MMPLSIVHHHAETTSLSLSVFLKREQEFCHSINAETTINRQSVSTVENVACINRSKTKTGEALVTDVEN